MSKTADPRSPDAQLNRLLAKNYHVFAVVIGLLWIAYAIYIGNATINVVLANGLGRFATQFGFERGDRFNTSTSEDIAMFAAVMTGLGLLILGGLLAPFGLRFGVITGIIGAFVLVVIAVPFFFTKNPLFAAVMIGPPVMALLFGFVLLKMLDERRKL